MLALQYPSASAAALFSSFLPLKISWYINIIWNLHHRYWKVWILDVFNTLLGASLWWLIQSSLWHQWNDFYSKYWKNSSTHFYIKTVWILEMCVFPPSPLVRSVNTLFLLSSNIKFAYGLKTHKKLFRQNRWEALQMSLESV
jgi:hypothetical protein